MKILRMNTLWFVPLLASMQSSPALAQGITLDELRGTTVAVTIARTQTRRRLMDGREWTGQVERGAEITFGPGNVLERKMTISSRGSNGDARTTVLPPRSIVIDKVWQRPPGVGSGTGRVVVVYLNSTLTFMEILSKGAWKFEIKFAHDSNGLVCFARMLHMRESGADSIVSYSLHDNAAGVLVKDRQISQTCRVTKP